LRERTNTILDLDAPVAGNGLNRIGHMLLGWARSDWLPGARSAGRKFRRRFAGRRFRVRCRAGFVIEGVIGDSVETACAVRREFEPGLSRLLAVQAPRLSTFVDLGCNVGYFTCLAAFANPAARILAVDANPAMVEACRWNVGINGGRAVVVNAAVGDANADTVLHVPRSRATRGTLGDASGAGTAVDAVPVRMRTLRDLLDGCEFPAVDLVKVDIEGYEARLFASVDVETIRRCEAIVFEFSEPNLAQCGSSRADLEAVPWMGEFEVWVMDDLSGRLTAVSGLSAVRGPEATVVLHRREGGRKLDLSAGL
jgi:FkbM family methyltransferase